MFLENIRLGFCLGFSSGFQSVLFGNIPDSFLVNFQLSGHGPETLVGRLLEAGPEFALKSWGGHRNFPSTSWLSQKIPSLFQAVNCTFGDTELAANFLGCLARMKGLDYVVLVDFGYF